MSTKNPIDEQLRQQEEAGNSIVDDYSTDMEAVVDELDTGRTEAIDAINQTEQAQKDALQAETDFTIRGIEQQKSEAKDDYYKEQKAAYGDYQRQVDPYGVNAERMAMSGLSQSGYAETSRVAMYNQYQQRITAARESYVKLQQDFNNQITAAKLANNSALAEIAAKAAVERATVIVEFATKRTDLLTTIAANKASMKQQNLSDWRALYDALQNSGGFPAETDDPANVDTEKGYEYDPYTMAEKEENAARAEAASDAMIGQKPTTQNGGNKNVSSIKNIINGIIANNLDSVKTKEAIRVVITNALQDKKITQAEAEQLRNIYLPVGVGHLKWEGERATTPDKKAEAAQEEARKWQLSIMMQ